MSQPDDRSDIESAESDSAAPLERSEQPAPQLEDAETIPETAPEPSTQSTERNVEDPRHLSSHTVRERLANHGAIHYLDFFNILQGVALAAAGLTLVKIGQDDWPLTQLAMLGVSLLAVAVAHSGATTGTPLLNLYPNSLDLLVPMTMAVAEFYLISSPGELGPNDSIPLDWFAILAAWQLLAGCLTLRVYRGIEPSSYTEDMREIVGDYKKNSLRIDILGAFATGTLTTAFVLISVTFEIPSDVTRFIAACATGAVFVRVIHDRSEVRAWILQNVDSKPPPEFANR